MREEKSSDKEATRGLRKERVGVVSSDKMNKLRSWSLNANLKVGDGGP